MTDIRSDTEPTRGPDGDPELELRRAGMAAAWVALAEHWTHYCSDRTCPTCACGFPGEEVGLRKIVGMLGLIEYPAATRRRRRPTGRLG